MLIAASNFGTDKIFFSVGNAKNMYLGENISVKNPKPL